MPSVQGNSLLEMCLHTDFYISHFPLVCFALYRLKSAFCKLNFSLGPAFIESLKIQEKSHGLKASQTC